MTDLSEVQNVSPIGQSIRRREDYRFLTGAGQYTDDVVLPGQTYGVFLRSPVRACADQSHRHSPRRWPRRAWCRSSPAPTSPKPRSAGCPAAG